MAANEPRTTSVTWSNGTTTDASAPDKYTSPETWFDYSIFKKLFPPLPGYQNQPGYAYVTDGTIAGTRPLEQPHPTGYTHVFNTTTNTRLTWGEENDFEHPRFQSLLRRPGETDEEYQVRADIAELSCAQGGHTWLKDSSSQLQTCEHCGGIGL